MTDVDEYVDVVVFVEEEETVSWQHSGGVVSPEEYGITLDNSNMMARPRRAIR